MGFDKKELSIIKEAVIEYEKRHYESEGQIWQKKINGLIDKLR